MTDEEKMKVVEALMFLCEKCDGTVKGRMVYNRKPMRNWLDKEETTSPMVALESVFLTSIIDIKEQHDTMSNDVPNAFIQAEIPQEDGDMKIIMKITGVLVDLLLELAPEVYRAYIVYEGNNKVLYIQVVCALYGMLVAALLWYKKFKAELEEIGFKFNPYDPCVANRMVNRKQHTVCYHVDDLISSHVDSKVNDEFYDWLNKMYGKHGDVSMTQGKEHKYLGMTLHYKEDELEVN